MTLEHLALSRATLDRAAHRRSDPHLLTRLLEAATTRILRIEGDTAAVVEGPDGPRLVLDPAVPPDRSPVTESVTESVVEPIEAAALLAFLGEDGDGHAYLLAAHPPAKGADRGPAGRTATLRDVGSLLDDTEAGLLTAAVALANWHTSHPRCARCGEVTQPATAGWTRRCLACGAEHFPRTDPAVIMSVVDDEDRILLGHQRVWPDKRFSTLAGFVEPGESLEGAVRREVHEEAGVVVDDVRYLGSQPWPFPASVMVGFTAHAATTTIEVDGAELQEARWWTREELGLDVATGELLLPPGVSIARRIIEHWYRGPIRDAGQEAWR